MNRAPTPPEDRVVALDALRGVALFGVCLVNVVTGMRMSLFAWLLQPHTNDGFWNVAFDDVVLVFFEQKAMVVFSLLFGVGLGMMRERAGTLPLVRRYAALLVVGLLHAIFVWNGDILTLYAVCAFVTLPLLALSPRTLAIVGFALIALYLAPVSLLPFPSPEAMARDAQEASRTYPHGTMRAIVVFRLGETASFILPLVASVVPRTIGLFALGAAARGIARDPPPWLARFATIAMPIGVLLAIADHLAAARVVDFGRIPLGAMAPIVLGTAYASTVLVLFPRARRVASVFAPIGRMAFTCYLLQSIAGVLIWQSPGLALMDRTTSLEAGAIATAVFAAQVVFARMWLARFRFGPLERAWRYATYLA
ncbi:MAG TPA: DUF418 domain-containing protein [Labilithrix sp.]|jgi:uncharacterized protein